MIQSASLTDSLDEFEPGTIVVSHDSCVPGDNHAARYGVHLITEDGPRLQPNDTPDGRFALFDAAWAAAAWLEETGSL